MSGSPRADAGRSADLKEAPTIISASSRADFSRGLHVATTFPERRIVALWQRSRISSSLCEM